MRTFVTAILFGLAAIRAAALPQPLEKRQSQVNLTSASNTSYNTISINSDPSSVQDSTAWSIIYTYPLAIFANVVGGILKTTNGSVNQFAHQRYLASPDETGVIKPNVDVLYSRNAIDLSRSDLVLNVPSVPSNRYFVVPIYDPYGNVLVELGTYANSTAGRYLITLSQSGVYGLSSSSNSSYVGQINVPTAYATFLVRYQVLTNSTDDINAIHALQDNTTVTPIARNGGSNSSIPTLVSLAPSNGTFLGIASPSAQLAFAAKLVPNAPSYYSASETTRIQSILASAGLSNATYAPNSSVNLTEAAIVANLSVASDISAPAHVRPQGNNWFLSIPSYQGQFANNYASAAYVALFGYQQQTVNQTLYPGFNSLGYSTVFNIQAGQAILVSFSGKPPVKQGGFWSISVYGSNQNLIRNSLYRFKVGSVNSSLTYADGTPIYGANATSRNDPFQVIIQPNQPSAANWTGNWLPGDPSTFTWLTRWYLPSDQITNGSYAYPVVSTVSAI